MRWNRTHWKVKNRSVGSCSPLWPWPRANEGRRGVALVPPALAHRGLPSGCRIDELRHQSVERLERAIAIRLVIAWRAMLMTLLGREARELPPDPPFSDIALRVLGDLAQSRQRPRPAAQTPTDVARLSYTYDDDRRHALKDDIG